MTTGLEIAILIAVLVALLGAAAIVRALKPFIVNAAIGLLAILAVDVLVGFSVAITPVSLLIVALGGLPGAVVVLALAYLEVAFVV